MRSAWRGVLLAAMRLGLVAAVLLLFAFWWRHQKEPDYRIAEGMEDTGSEIAVPLLMGGRVLGVIDVQAMETGRFGSDDLQVLQLEAVPPRKRQACGDRFTAAPAVRPIRRDANVKWSVEELRFGGGRHWP